jgi:hypothetical protein
MKGMSMNNEMTKVVHFSQLFFLTLHPMTATTEDIPVIRFSYGCVAGNKLKPFRMKLGRTGLASPPRNELVRERLQRVLQVVNKNHHSMR